MQQEKESVLLKGYIAVILQLALFFGGIYYSYSHWTDDASAIDKFVIPIIMIIASLIVFGSYVVVSPNQAEVLTFFGSYKSTITKNGFWAVHPFYSATSINLKTQTLETQTLEVNERNGVPIQIAAIVNFKISDTYKYAFGVDNVLAYLTNQAELELRDLAKNHLYNELAGEEKDLITELNEKVAIAGIEVVSAKISHLNYVASIASGMLQKQQAQSMSEARGTIVENATKIATAAGEAIKGLSPDAKAKFIANLVLVMCSEKGISPVINIDN
jgi:regulator of protease activity HflC (stomatin/prohibitin superfamily)